MGNKNRKHHRKPAQPRSQQQGPFDALGRGGDVSAEDKQLAVARLVKALKLLSANPEGIMEMLARLGVPVKKVQNVPGDPQYDTYVILVQHMAIGEMENQRQGSLLQRTYGSNVIGDGPPLPPNTHDPVTGQPLRPTYPMPNSPEYQPVTPPGQQHYNVYTPTPPPAEVPLIDHMKIPVTVDDSVPTMGNVPVEFEAPNENPVPAPDCVGIVYPPMPDADEDDNDLWNPDMVDDGDDEYPLGSVTG
jgi:hypothetical protein